MKVVAFNGSTRADGNTTELIKKTFAPLNAHGIETEIVVLGTEQIRGCIACRKCSKTLDQKCSIVNDNVNEYIQKMVNAQAIILASPTYFADVTSNMKSLMDRCGVVGRANGNIYKRKVGAGIVAVRRAGAIHVFDSLNHFFTISEMITVGSNYWNIGIGREKGDVLQDEEGLKTMAVLGENMSWLLKKLYS